MKRKIFMFHYEDVMNAFNGEMPDTFEISEWNEKDNLPKEVIELMAISKLKDLVYTLDNFMLDFNLQDPTTYHGDYIMFIPDEKFSNNVEFILS